MGEVILTAFAVHGCGPFHAASLAAFDALDTMGLAEGFDAYADGRWTLVYAWWRHKPDGE